MFFILFCLILQTCCIAFLFITTFPLLNAWVFVTENLANCPMYVSLKHNTTNDLIVFWCITIFPVKKTLQPVLGRLAICPPICPTVILQFCCILTCTFSALWIANSFVVDGPALRKSVFRTTISILACHNVAVTEKLRSVINGLAPCLPCASSCDIAVFLRSSSSRLFCCGKHCHPSRMDLQFANPASPAVTYILVDRNFAIMGSRAIRDGSSCSLPTLHDLL